MRRRSKGTIESLIGGHVFSAPMELLDIVRELDEVDQTRATVALPHTGKVLVAIVQIHISGSLHGITKYIKQATVRKEIVQRLIILQADSGNRAYESYRSDGTGNADELKDMKERLRDLNRTDRYGKVVAGEMGPIADFDITHFLDGQEDLVEDLEINKAATPAEVPREAPKVFNDRRPNVLVLQRDSDSQKTVDENRGSALLRHASLDVRTSSTLIPQFRSKYITRVFPFTLRQFHCGPDFRGQERDGRTAGDAGLI